jgi:molybdate transport system substrate-binding protein
VGYLELMRAMLAVSAVFLCALSACRNTPPPAKPALTVAAAANLTGAVDELAAAFERNAGLHVSVSTGSTAQLAQQLTNGAPFDVFLAADEVHIQRLVERGIVTPHSRSVYALGRLALWVPDASRPLVSLQDLAAPSVRYIAVAQPELAPYGSAAVEALRNSGIWENVRGRIVYAPNINVARQLAASGNADAALTAYPLVMKDSGGILLVDGKLHTPIRQALGIPAASPHAAQAQAFRDFVLGSEGRAILARRGYDLP